MAWSVDELRERVRLEPSGRFLLPLAEALLRRGEAREALTLLERGLESRGEHVAARVAQGRCLLDLDRPREALELFEQVLATDPMQMVAARFLVETAIRIGDAERAAQALATYCELQPHDPAIASFETRISGLGTGPSTVQEDELVTVTLGNLYLEQGHRREAEAIFRRLLRRDPNDGAARSGLARARAQGERAPRQRRHDIVRESVPSEGDAGAPRASSIDQDRGPQGSGRGGAHDREPETC